VLERARIVVSLIGCAVAVPAVAAAPPPGATSCSGCHAAAPGTTTAIPPLRDLTAAQIESALLAYKSGGRTPTVMDRIAKGFSDQEIADLATWFGQGG
jgi:sulfide dehydrogenase cytochrome subunit